MFGAGLDGVEFRHLLMCQGAVQLHQQGACETDDGVQWRTQFVGHAGQEVVLGQIGLFQFGGLLLKCHFDHLARTDIADDGRKARTLGTVPDGQ